MSNASDLHFIYLPFCSLSIEGLILFVIVLHIFLIHVYNLAVHVLGLFTLLLQVQHQDNHSKNILNF